MNFWLDVLELLVPVGTAFSLIWARAAYEKRVELRAKRECVWRGLDQEVSLAVGAFANLETIQVRALKGELAVWQMEIPEFLITATERLAELDAKHAYIFAELVGLARIVRRDMELLTDYIKSGYINSHVPPLLQTAISKQAQALRGDLLQLVESAVKVLNAIHAGDSQFDRQVVDRAVHTVRLLKTSGLSAADQPVAAGNG